MTFPTGVKALNSRFWRIMLRSNKHKRNITLFLLMFIVPLIVVSPLPDGLIFQISDGPDIGYGNFLVGFVLTVVFYPVIETFIFCTLIYYISGKISKRNKTIVFIISSSLIFGSLHYYSFPYIIWATVSGYFLSLFYVLCVHKKEKAALQVIIMHGARNFLSLSLVYILGYK